MRVAKKGNIIIGELKKEIRIQLKNIKHIFLGVLAVVAATLLTSCDSGKVYDEYHPVNPEGWYKNDTLVFKPVIKDSSQLYNLIFNVRHTTDYNYRNLYFFTQTHFPDGNMVEDTIELMLADKGGEWFGSGFGAIRNAKIMIMQRARFHHEGEYRFEVRQAMRSDSLKGIEDIGIRIEKYQ